VETKVLRSQTLCWYGNLTTAIYSPLDETLYHISLSQQLMPFLTSQSQVLGGTEAKLPTDLSMSDPLLPGLTGPLPSFDLLPQPLNLEGNSFC
jgi:hypothetical protein